VSEDEADGALASQVQALLSRVERAAQARCAALEEEAGHQSRKLLEEGRAQAHLRVRTAVREERARLAEGLRQAQAQADLEQRKQDQAQLQELLLAMWRELPGLLEARWQDAQARRIWVEAALDVAGRLLPGRAWTLELASDFPVAARAALEAHARTRGATQVSWARDPSAGAGVRIRAGGACLSATIPGLLARRADIEAAFLAAFVAPGADPAPQEPSR
jgi:hypothetical protein